MGIRLIVEVLDDAPAALTQSERYALVVLAETARDETRLCLAGIEDNPEVIRRLRMGRSRRYEVIKGLVEKGALSHVVRGQKGVRAVYAIAKFARQRPENPDPDTGLSVPETRTLNDEDRPQCPENPDAEPVDNPSQRPETQDPEPVDNSLQGPETPDPPPVDNSAQGPAFPPSGSGNSGFRVRESRTPSPQSPQSPQRSLSAPERIVRAARVVADDEERDFVAWITHHHDPRGIGWWRTVNANGDLADIAARWQAARLQTQPPHDIAAELAAARTNPDLACDHRPGGLHRRTDTGRLLCPQCQLAATPREAAS